MSSCRCHFAPPGAPEGLVDDGLEVLDQVVGRRLVVVQLVHHAQAQVLAEAEAVVGQQLVVDDVLVGSDERQHRPDVLLVGVDAGDQRRAGDEVDVGEGLVGLLEVRQDPLVAHAGPLLVPLRDRQLVVVEHRVDVGQHLLHVLPGHVARRLDGRVEAALVGPLQQGGAEVRLQQALAAGEGHAAAGGAVDGLVLLHLGQHLVHGHPLAEHLERARRAERSQRLVAVAGQVPVDVDRVIGALDHVEGRLRGRAASGTRRTPPCRCTSWGRRKARA